MTTLIRGLHNLFWLAKNQALAVKRCVATIGNFDGVHLGHQALLQHVVQKAQALRTTSLVILFEPQPFEFFAQESVAPRLTRWREKFSLLAELGIDAVLIIRFNAEFAAMTADEFVQRVLVDALAVQAIVVGDDFQFGRGREGNFAFLQQAGQKIGFTVEAMPTIKFAHERVSSTLVRHALATAQHERVKQLLGRPYIMQGRVVHGDKRGRILGFPTANIFLHRRAVPVHGVYAVRVHGLAANSLPGVANVGERPTVNGTRTLLEVHLFDFDREIYGRHVGVEFYAKLRDEMRFANLDLLKEQIWLDANNARNYFDDN